MCSDDTTVRIPLRAVDGSVRAYTVVDSTDADWASQWRWHLLRVGYAARSEHNHGNRRMFYLHRELMGLSAGDGLTVDHRNLDKLDNRRSNLRVIPQSGQPQNRPQINNGWTSTYRGVSWHSGARKWRARIEVGGKAKLLGLFSSEEEAAEVARAARLTHMPYATD
jgi:hypothetical protein